MKMTAADVKWAFWTVLIIQVVVLLLATLGSYAFTYVMVGIAGCLFQIIAISRLKGLLAEHKDVDDGVAKEVMPVVMAAILKQAASCDCDHPQCLLHGEGGLLEGLGFERIDSSPPNEKDAAN